MAEPRFMVGERLAGDFDNHIAVVGLYFEKEDAVARRREIIRLRASPTSMWPRPEAVTAGAVHVWELVQ